MSMGHEYRRGIDDRPASEAEYERMKKGGHLYEKVDPPKRSDSPALETKQRTSA